MVNQVSPRVFKCKWCYFLFIEGVIFSVGVLRSSSFAVLPSNFGSYLEDQEAQALLAGLAVRPCQEVLEAHVMATLPCWRMSSGAIRRQTASLQGKKHKNFKSKILRDDIRESTPIKDGWKYLRWPSILHFEWTLWVPPWSLDHPVCRHKIHWSIST